MVIAVYSQVGNHAFLLYDDFGYVTENPPVLGGLTWPGISWAFSAFHAHNWHPLTWLTHMAVVELFGPDAGWHHRVNLLIHTANTALLFLVLRGMTGALWRSAFVAALFGVHPLHVESVAWVAELKDVLSAMFWMLAVSAYLSYARHPSRARYLLVVILFAMGLMAKPMLVTLPFVLLLLDYWPLGRWMPGGAARPDGPGVPLPPVSRLRLVLEKLPLLLLSAGSSVLTYAAQRSGAGAVIMAKLSLGDRIANAVVSYGKYLWKTVCPASLSIIYPHPAYFGGVSRRDLFASAFVLILVTGAAAWQARRRPFLAVGWFWYLGTLVPVIGLIQVGVHAMADRYTYLPLIGVFLSLAWGIPGMLPRRVFRGRWLAAAAVGVLAIYGGLAWRQVGYWKDGVALFSHAVDLHPNEPEAMEYLGKAHNGMGVELFQKGKIREAASHFREARKLNPTDIHPLLNLGIVQLYSGDVDGAIRIFQAATEMRPADARGRQNLEYALRVKRQREAGGTSR